MSATAIGTNATATAAMLKAGADEAPPEKTRCASPAGGGMSSPGPLGIVIADSLLGEVTPAMALAVGRSPAVKVLLPVNRCRNLVVGVADAPVSELIRQAVEQIAARLPLTTDTEGEPRRGGALFLFKSTIFFCKSVA